MNATRWLELLIRRLVGFLATILTGKWVGRLVRVVVAVYDRSKKKTDISCIPLEVMTDAMSEFLDLNDLQSMYHCSTTLRTAFHRPCLRRLDTTLYQLLTESKNGWKLRIFRLEEMNRLLGTLVAIIDDPNNRPTLDELHERRRLVAELLRLHTFRDRASKQLDGDQRNDEIFAENLRRRVPNPWEGLLQYVFISREEIVGNEEQWDVVPEGTEDPFILNLRMVIFHKIKEMLEGNQLTLSSRSILRWEGIQYRVKRSLHPTTPATNTMTT